MTFHYRMRARLLVVAGCCVVTLSGILSAFAQNAGGNAKQAKGKVADAMQQGMPLTHVASTDVTNNVSVEATLIPARIARVVFGEEISNTYAVIALTVSNRSANQAFIVHSIFIDYSQWLLSGASPFQDSNNNRLCPSAQKNSSAVSPRAVGEANLGLGTPGTSAAVPAPVTQTPGTDAASNDLNQAPGSCYGNSLENWQQQTFANQIASVEGRIVRQQLVNKQPWTTRNWVLRALEGAGSIASGFTFATASQSWIRGIGAFNGSGIPAYEQLWPDSTVNQLNEISNVGFFVNKVVAKQNADIVVAFFPIDRFLTPELKSLFISHPAAFFSPVAALVDQSTEPKLRPYLEKVFGADEDSLVENMLKYIPLYGTGACEKALGKGKDSQAAEEKPLALDKDSIVTNPAGVACLTAAVINRISLNTVRVIVGGTMAVDVNSVPPQITSVDIDVPDGKSASNMFTVSDEKKPVTLSGAIHGSFLGGAKPELVGVPAGMTINGVSDGSTDTLLNFTLTLTQTPPASTKELSFQASKSSASGSTLKSAVFQHQIADIEQPAQKADTDKKPADQGNGGSTQPKQPQTDQHQEP
jgi:hypothetical protein